MASAAQNHGGSLSVHEVLCRWAPAYLAQFGAAMPSRQREVLQSILACRTPALGGSLHYCPNCDHRHFSYHSCNDRHCPQCGGQDAQEWLDENTPLLLPVNYFLVTFTVPEGLRRWIRSHPRLGYDLLLAASSQALQDLAQNSKRLGASLGLLGVTTPGRAPLNTIRTSITWCPAAASARTSASGSPAGPSSSCRSKP